MQKKSNGEINMVIWQQFVGVLSKSFIFMLVNNCSKKSLWKWSDEIILINKWGWLFCVFEYFSKNYSNYLCSIVNLKHCWFLIIEISLFLLSWLWFRNKQRIKHWKYFSIYNLRKEHHLNVGVWKQRWFQQNVLYVNP